MGPAAGFGAVAIPPPHHYPSAEQQRTEDDMERRAPDASTHVDTNPIHHTDLTPYAWSYGMGAESTAGICRMLTDPSTRPDTIAPDYSNLVVVIAQTGDEWSTTGKLV
ncbi:hypothetical protein [Amycolatopsis arida]|nr:hypothetical protein [Amycolatopsis arida]